MREDLGYYQCDTCGGKFQVLDEAGENVDWNASVEQVRTHKQSCTESDPFTDDPNAYY